MHPMGVDNAGELHGSDSPQYRSHVLRQDVMLAALIVEWNGLGYTVLVTGDHGMNPDGDHGGSTPDVREVPLYLVGPDLQGMGNTGRTVSQLQIAPTVLRLLDVPIPGSMPSPPLDL